ncbi:MAG: ATPase, T2SS/T4P/T4SS family [Smithellaceae bacterium]
MLKRFTQVIVYCAQRGYSDLHICGDQPIVYRKDGKINFSGEKKFSQADVENLIKTILNNRQYSILRRRWSVDLAFSVGNIRVRISVFNTVSGPSIAVRLLPGTVPTIENLNLHPSLHEISALKSGLVLICGTTGSGKTTTIASVLDDLNHQRFAHIVTLEDPIEYRIQSVKSFVEQREVGTHVPSVERGLIDVMRADPDVIMVGELRDPVTIRLTLNAAESGHLVIATLHATNMEDALYRIINSVPPEAEEYVRYQLASTLSWIVLQKLVFSEKTGFRIPLLSILRGTSQIKGIIRDKKLHQIENALHTGKADGMFTQERYQKEVLDSEKKYANPNVNFKPSADAGVDAVVTSHLFDAETGREEDWASQGAAATPSVEKNSRIKLPSGKKASRSLVDPEGLGADDAHYVISDSDELSDIIARAENEFLSDK